MQATLAAKPSRLSSFTVVVLLHAVGIWLLANGLMHRAPAPASSTPQVEIKDSEPLEREPEPVRKMEKPQFDLPTLPPVPAPDFLSQEPVVPSISAQPSNETTPSELSRPQAGTFAPPVEPTTVASAPVAAGLLCNRMPPPEMPSTVLLDQSVEMRVLGTVRGGRVVAVEFSGTRGLNDRRQLRQLQQAVDRALRDGYQCSSEGRFEQEFVFRPE